MSSRHWLGESDSRWRSDRQTGELPSHPRCWQDRVPGDVVIRRSTNSPGTDRPEHSLNSRWIARLSAAVQNDLTPEKSISTNLLWGSGAVTMGKCVFLLLSAHIYVAGPMCYVPLGCEETGMFPEMLFLSYCHSSPSSSWHSLLFPLI